jgi:hypothetical protein
VGCRTWLCLVDTHETTGCSWQSLTGLFGRLRPPAANLLEWRLLSTTNSCACSSQSASNLGCPRQNLSLSGARTFVRGCSLGKVGKGEKRMRLHTQTLGLCVRDCGLQQQSLSNESRSLASAKFSSYLVDPASSHMLVPKIKPCMSKYKPLYTVKLRMAH